MARDPAAFASVARRVARGLLRVEREQVCCEDFTLQQFDTLRVLRDEPALTTGEIAARLGIELSTASRNLAVLERDGFVASGRSEGDARRVTRTLTPRGARRLGTVCCDERLVYAALLARVPEGDRDAVVTALGALARALEEPAAAAAAAAAAPAPAPAPACCPAPARPERKKAHR